MNAIEYTRKLRRVAVYSWLSSLILFLGLAWLGVVPFHEALPLLALLIGSVPIILFMAASKVRCESCGGPMKITSGYPRIVFRCRTCGSEVDTGIYSDY